MGKGKTLSSVIRKEMRSPTFRKHYEKRVARWPKECPVFEVLILGEHVRAGAIVEGFGPDIFVNGRWYAEIPGYLCVRAVDYLDVISADQTYKSFCTGELGFFGVQIKKDGLRPLTKAAREMLALVKP